MNEFIDTTLDDKFLNIESLQWLPFIGKDYFQAKTKTLIIGESHYVPINEDPDFYNDITWTRQFILKEGLQIEPWNISKTKNNLVREVEKTLTGDLSNDFWNQTAYFNLIQRLLPSRKGVNRPTFQDIKNGLFTFKEMVGLLDPDIVFFCGIEASKHFQNLLSSDNFQIEKHKFGEEKINGTYPKSFELTLNGKKCLCYFVKHPSTAYSADQWRKFILEK